MKANAKQGPITRRLFSSKEAPVPDPTLRQVRLIDKVVFFTLVVFIIIISAQGYAVDKYKSQGHCPTGFVCQLEVGR